ncbi:importin subunit beta-3 [Ophidiomyces ophidiicola]|uniref:importin subunit beta-3 n=1 Tax=Ophidiomyces ophidiicola TaxID=1387563 RepID=UPI0020C3CD1C|nr:importin subunit beta-3 [Ophidiomyces ophidiicola]KAI1948004.1 importin subunit beta-3 [Ophidiomyces ophidiicola]KAI1949716.1 importin subunit beta-3 [Ophidiomyces ophidiicola]KAI1961622.1 importin subunit beta-3 [Ophidiomyces ophidiicola]KAI1974210.1 importin subunit beta-3 [Ophidiomyces ophidiicola]KAI2028572.1 importin subunit beta-3 [Ophidiomyces ophidiicola]
MSILPPEIHTALSQLLLGLATPDNLVRTQAEERLNNEWVQERPDVLLMGLAEQLHAAEDSNTRTFAAVLFRRIAARSVKDPNSTDSRRLFFTLSPDHRIAIRQKLLQALNGESVSNVRNKVGDAVAAIAEQYTESGEPWPELLGVLFQASQSSDTGLRESAFRIFSTTPRVIEKQHEETVLGVFMKGFKDEHISVRISAMEAFASFFGSLHKKSQSKYFSLVPDLLNILPPLKEADESEELSKAFVSLIDIAELCPKMFRPLFNNLVKFSISVIADKELSDQVRQNALELMATFADYAPTMCKKDPDFAKDMVTQCLSLMTDVGLDDDDAAEWGASEDLDLEDSDKNHVAGEQCMDRLANKLGGEIILPPTFNWVPRMISSAVWRDRHAALMAISAISEGCSDLMVNELQQVLALVIPALQDPHPRVKFAGCNALGQMSTDFAGTMQEKYHSVILGNLIPSLNSEHPRVQAHAAAALVNFCEEAEPAILEPYLEQLLGHLVRLLQSPKKFVQGQALCTIATIADSAEATFANYYDRLMPMLFNVLREEQSKEYREIRAKAMECATLIALAVGKDKMGQDALTLAQLLAHIQQNITDADDPQSSYLLHCWGRMCRVLGTDFVPYLPGVMPPLLQVAAAKADLQILDDEAQIQEVEQDGKWDLLPLKDKVIGIKTSVLEDKNVAIELITIYAQVLQAAFEPYVVEPLEKIALPGLTFFFHDPVRVSCAKLIPHLLNAYKKAHGDRSPEFYQLWSKTVEKIIECLSAEPSVDTLAEIFQCYYESLEVAGKNSLTQDQMQAFVEGTRSTLEDYQIRVKRRMDEKAEVEEGDDETLSFEYEVEEDQNLLSDMNKAFHTTFKNQGSDFLPAWERILPFYDVFVVSEEPTQRQWALCVIDDVLEFCGEHSWNYKNHILQPLINGMRDDNAANRQAASYGVGVAAQKGGAAWSEFVAASIPTLFQVTQHAEARSEDHVFATENACASIAKILHFNASKVQNPQQVADNWVNTLPILNDEEAAPYGYSFLAQLIDQQNPAVLTHAQNALTYVVQALDAETLQGGIAERVVVSAKRLLTVPNVNLEQALSNEMTEGTASSPGLEPQKVLVFGATGLIGSKILSALVAIKAHLESIAVFTSLTTLEKKSEFLDDLKNEGIRVITGNLNNEDDIRRIDTVISALGREVLSSQIPLIRLAASPSSSVKWFFPSEYGTDIEYSPASAQEKPHQQKLKVRAALDEVKGTLAHTYVVTGPFADLYLGPGLRDARGGAFKVKERRADLLGDGHGKISLTTMDDVGKLVAAAILQPSLAKNRALKVNSFTTTPADILAEFERQTGGQSWGNITHTPLDELRKLEEEAWNDGVVGKATVLTLRRIWTEGGTLYEKRDNEAIGAPPMETLEQAVSKAIKEQTEAAV